MISQLRASISAPTLSLAGLLCLPSVVADEVVMASGDRLTGRILHAGQDRVLLKTAYAGILAIERGQVQALHRGPVPPVIQPTDAAAGDVADASQAARRRAAPPPPADGSPAPAASTSTRSSLFTPGSKLSGRVNFALSDDKGNTDKNEIDFDYQVDYRWGWNRFNSIGTFEFDTNEGEKTTDKWSSHNHYSRRFPTRWYGAAWLGLKHDRFADLRLRTLGGPSVGYLAFEGKALNLSLEAGPTLLADDYYDHTDQKSVGVGWLLRYDQLVWLDRLQLYHRQFGYSAFDGDPKTLWQSWTGLRVPLAGGFTGGIEFEYDYDSNPAVEAKTTDTTLRLKLGYQWQ